MIITLITHPPLFRLSHHSISYSNLPHSVSLSMMNPLKLKSCIYFAEIQMIVQERSSGSEELTKSAMVTLHPSKGALCARQQREHRAGCQEDRKCTFKEATLCVLPYVLEQNCQCQSVITNSCFNLQTKHLRGD